jgi:nucleoside-diphosphate-sugar epimerase
MQRNVVGTYVVLEEARKTTVKRCLCASSINAFGTFDTRLSGKPPLYTRMPLDETFHPVPEDSYSLSKYCNELTCAAFARAFGITTAAFRFAAVWGDEFYRKFRTSGLKPAGGWSDDLYQWVHVYDIVAGIRKAMECPDLPAHGVYTLSGPDMRIADLTMEFLWKYRPDLAETVDPPLAGREPLLSIRKARQTFGYPPKYRLMD